jgi:PAS domain S-box-containing protein
MLMEHWSGRKSGAWRLLAGALVLLCAGSVLAPEAESQQQRPVRRILIVNEAGVAYPAIDTINRGIRTEFESSPYKIELYSEYLETILFPDSAVQQEFRAFILRKYQNRRPDVIITVGPSALQFMRETHKTAFNGVPVIFCLPNGSVPGSPIVDSDFTGVENDMAAGTTLEAAMRMQPDIQHVFVVGGQGNFDKQQQVAVREQLKPFEKRLDIEYLTSLAMPDLLERLRHLPSNSVVLLTTIAQDAAGNRFKSNESGPLIVGAASAPVFSLFDTYVNHGEVGGDLSSFSEQGRIAGSMALRILNGEKPQDIPPATDVTKYMFDWQALRRWGLKDRNLPPGSIVINRQLSFWELYRRYVIAGAVVLLAQTGVIFGLLWQRSQKKKNQNALALVNEHLRLAMDASKAVGWHLDLKTRQNTWFGDLESMFGLPSDIFSKEMGEFIHFVHPDDQRRFSDGVDYARTHREPYVAEFRVIRRDGIIRWIACRGEFDYAFDGKAMRLVGMAVDVTDRKLAEERIRESEERFRLVANTAPVMIWMSGLDKRFTYFNKPWLDFTGRTLEQELGDGWAEGVHAEDLERCLKTYVESFDAHESFEMEYRLRRHDGEHRWVVDLGVPRFNADGSFAGYIGSCIDVTERKLAEEALSTVSRRLIEAQEEERAWVARELHDDVNQRLALIAVNLDVLKRELPQSATEAWLRLSELREQIKELGIDVQALSHRLHSSKLKYLGLTAAAKAFCREFSERKRVQIDFRCDSVPRTVPDEVSLCLFRVLQEALQNASNHSESQHYQVSIKYAPNEIALAVSDAGIGFDPLLAMQGRGLGITSMRERLKLVDGELSIEAGSPNGTVVRARIPVPEAAVKPASAGKL